MIISKSVECYWSIVRKDLGRSLKSTNRLKKKVVMKKEVMKLVERG
jgi:hypothetical protein